MFKKVATAVTAVAFAAQAAAAQTLTPVDIELKLLIDVSGSVNTSEYNLQKNGYVNVFNNTQLWTTFAGTNQTLAVSYSEWASSTLQRTNWFMITNAATAKTFADAIALLTRTPSQTVGSGTALGQAVTFGISALNTNSFDGAKKIIDFSGDGCSSSGVAGKTAATAAGVVLNGLAIGGSNVQNCYATYVTDDGFVQAASSFDDFDKALTLKISKEIGVPVPEPSTFALVGLGLFGLVRTARRRRA